MAQTIKLKRSASQGAVPSTSALALGEIAINTYDGKLFIKKDDGSESIVTIGTLENNAVTSAKIAANAVTSSEIAKNAVGASEIAANSVGISELNVSDGTNGQVLTTDGSGALSFTSKTATAQSFYLNTATGDGSTTGFTLSTTPAGESYIIAFVDGVFQNQDSYTFSGTTLTFDTAPPNGSTVTVYVVGSIYSGNSVVLNTFSGDNSTVAFTLSENPQSENNTQVYIDGVYQQKSEYSVSGTTLTFSSAPPTGTSNIEVIMFSSTNFSVLNANSVTSASIAAGAVNTSDIADNAITSAKIASGVIVASDVADNSITSAKIALNAVGASELAATALSGHDTDDLSEGSTNLYYTDARAQAVSINNVVEDTTPQLGGTLDTNGNLIQFGDSSGGTVNRLQFGASQDLQIHHDGTHSYLLESNATGNLYLGGDNLFLSNANVSKTYLKATDGGAVELRYNNAAKLATTSAGIDVTGEVLADSLDIDGNGDISGNLTLGGYLAGPATFTIDPAAVGDNTGTVVIAGNLQVDGTTTTINSTTLTVDDKLITLASGSINAAAADGAGIEVDITGSTNPSLTYDGTNDQWDFNKPIESTRVNTNTVNNVGNSANIIYRSSTNTIVGNNATALVVQDAGNVGIGTSSPDGNLEVVTSTVVSGASDTVNNVLIGLQSANRPTIILDTADTTYTNRTWNITNVGASGHLTIGRNGLDVITLKNDGNVGIGTTSPSAKLTIVDATAPKARFTDSTDFYYTEYGRDGIDAYSNTNGSAPIFFKTGGTERMRIDSSGNVGIGITSPASNLHIKTSVDNSVSQGLVIERSANSDRGYINYNGGAFRFVATDGDPIRFGHVSSSDRVTIDSSGNLLVSLTNESTWTNTAGFATRASGSTTITRSAAQPLLVNRLTSDGDIAVFYKDGTAVGSIGTTSSYTYIAGNNSSAGNGSGLNFGTAIEPTNRLGGVHNGITDLGSSSNKFKDLYLSGNISIGNSSSITSSNGSVNIGGAQSNYVEFLTSTGSGQPRIRPSASGTVDIGDSTLRFKDLYLSGGASAYNFAATNSISVDNSSGYGAMELGGTSGAYIDLKSPSSDDYDLRLITFNTGGQIIAAAGSPLLLASSGNSNQLYLDSSGNVGIGTSSPAIGGGRTYSVALTIDGGTSAGIEDTGALELGGSTSVDDRIVGSLAFFNNDNSNVGATTRKHVAFIEARSVTSDSNAGDDSGGDLVFTTKAEAGALTERMRIDSSGNVGIGTSSPFSKLSINSNGAPATSAGDMASTGLTVHNGTGGTAVQLGTYDAGSWGYIQSGYVNNATVAREFRIMNGANYTMTLTNTGNVGIGTTSPAYKLDVAGKGRFINNADTAAITLERTDATTGAYFLGVDGDGAYRLSSASQVHQQIDDQGISYYRAYTDMTFGTGSSGTERMRIDSSGNLLVGTTSSTLSGTDDGFVFHQDGNSSFVTGTGIMYMRRTTSNGTHIKFRSTTNATVGQIDSDGSNTSYVTSSDYRLKENVVYDFDALTRVQQLKPARFNFIENPEVTQDGFIAHEVQDIVPIAVSGIKDAVDEEGNIEPQGVDHSKLVPLLTKAIQELNAKLEAAEARITELEG